MARNTRTAVLAAALILSFLCIGADNTLGFPKTSRSELVERVESLEKENVELRRQVADLNTKIDLLSQRVNAGCAGAPQGAAAAGTPQPAPPSLDVVRLSPESQAPQKPKGRLIITNSDEEAVSLIEHGAPLPGTNYFPLPDPAGTVSATGQPAAAAAMAMPDNPAPEAKTKVTLAESEAYARIKALIDGGDRGGARPLMQDYLKSHSGGTHEDDVAYWLGDCWFEAGDYKQAIESYLIVTDQHPESARAPEALYKAGLSYLELGRTDEGADALREVRILYPFSDSAQKAEAKLATCCQ